MAEDKRYVHSTTKPPSTGQSSRAGQDMSTEPEDTNGKSEEQQDQAIGDPRRPEVEY